MLSSFDFLVKYNSRELLEIFFVLVKIESVILYCLFLTVLSIFVVFSVQSIKESIFTIITHFQKFFLKENDLKRVLAFYS